MSEGTQKRCTKCKEHKPSAMFDKNKGRKDGLSDRCKSCRAEYRAANAQAICEYNKVYKRANAEAIRQYNHDYHAAHAESIHERQRAYKEANAEKMRQSYRAYYAAHVEVYRAYARAYVAAHRETKQAYDRAYNAANPDKCRVANHRRRARIKGNGGSFTVKQIRELYQAQQGCCAYCERQIKLTIDHIIPIKQGGSSNISNICLACRRCNCSKGARTPEQWMNRWYQQTDD